MIVLDTPNALLATQFIQMSVVTGLAWIAWRLLARDRPHLSHAIWAVVLLKCITPPIIYFPGSPFCFSFSPTNHASVSATPTIVTTPQSGGPLPDVTFRTLQPIQQSDVSENRQSQYTTKSSALSVQPALIWLIAGLIGIAFSACRYLAFVARLRTKPDLPMDDMSACVERLRLKLNLRGKVRVRIIQQPIGPAVIGLWRPTILLPACVVDGKSPAELEPLIAHELVHIRRGDLWWSLLQSAARSLWWYHPMVWLSCNLLNQSTEQSCDEETVASLGCRPSAYARALLSVLEIKHRLRCAPALPGVRPVDLTSKRMERIMNFGMESHAKCPRWAWICVLTMSACVLPGAAALRAQKPAAGDEAKTTETELPTDRIVRKANQLIYTTRVYRVADVLKKVQECGVSEDKAAEKLLSILPSRNVPPAPEPTSQEVAANPKPGPLPKDTRGQASPKDAQDRTTMSFDATSASLVITATAPTHDAVVASLERIREYGLMQIVVEMIIIEVNEDKVANAPITKTNEKWIAEQDSSQELAESLPQERLKFSDVAKENQISNWVNRMIKDGTSQVISAPKLLTLNGQQAEIRIGRQLPIMQTTGGKYEMFSVVEVGLKAALTPKLIEKQKVHLELEAEISEPTGETKTSKHELADGQTATRLTPEVETVRTRTQLVLPVDEFTLLAGPIRAKNEESALRLQDEKFSTQKKQLLMLVVCHPINPFQVDGGEEDDTNVKPLPINQEIDTSKTGDKRIQIGKNKALHVSGSVQIRNEKGRSILTGTQIKISLEDPQVTHKRDWATISADRFQGVLNPKSNPNEWDLVSCFSNLRLNGNVVYALNSEERITASELVLDGDRSQRGLNVQLDLEEMKLRADKLEWTRDQNLSATGNVSWLNGETKIQAERLRYDADSQTITAFGVKNLTQNGEFSLKAEEIEIRLSPSNDLSTKDNEAFSRFVQAWGLQTSPANLFEF